jgi:polyisoprenoid-binding protein YceI
MILLLLTAMLATACGLLQEPEEASAPIEAIPLDVAEASDALDPVEEGAGDVGTTADAPEQIESGADTAAEALTEGSGSVSVYQISQADSQVRFQLDEDLRGLRNTVVGTTNQVAGEIAFDSSDLSTVQLGVIQINARTLVTDNNFRNRALANDILDTGAHEFITLTPTAINGLPATAAVGEGISFTIDSQLTIRDITQAVTFEVVAMVVSESQIQGNASAVVSREDYGLNIPSVPNVANVEDEVELYIDFVANAQ